MLDKLGLSVLIVFIFGGLMVYDRYVKTQGEVGIVAQALDYTGLGRLLQKPAEEPILTKKTTRTSFEELQTKFAQIQKKRAEMILHRQDILRRISELNDQIQSESAGLIEAIGKERKIVEAHLPEIHSQSQQMIASANVSQDSSSQGSEKLMAFLKEFQRVTSELQRECEIFSDNTSATEAQFASGWETTNATAKDLVQKLVQVTEQDLRDLMRLYQELNAIQTAMEESLQLNCQRLREAFKEAQRKESDILAALKQEGRRKAYADFLRVYFKVEEGRINLFSDLAKNEMILDDTWQKTWKDYAVFLESQAMNAGYVLLAQNVFAPPAKQGPVGQGSPEAFSPFAQPGKFTASSAGEGYLPSPKQKTYYKSLDELIRPMRDKAKDNKSLYDNQKSKDVTIIF